MEYHEKLAREFETYLNTQNIENKLLTINCNNGKNKTPAQIARSIFYSSNCKIYNYDEKSLGCFEIGTLFTPPKNQRYIVGEYAVKFTGVFTGNCDVLKNNSNIFYYVLYFLNKLNNSSERYTYSISKFDNISLQYQYSFHNGCIDIDDIICLFEELLRIYPICGESLYRIMYENAEPEEEFEKIEPELKKLKIAVILRNWIDKSQ
jgi:hypothetical protein